MRRTSLLAVGLAAGSVGCAEIPAIAQTDTPRAHVRNSFHFVVPASLSRASAFFGPEGERCWAGEHRNPVFLYPQPAEDVEGAVFMVQHGPHKSVWVNTLLDQSAGRMQYVSFVPDRFVFTVEARLSALTPSTTKVEVTYVRTALDATANEDVIALGKRDGENGTEWQQAIEHCLAVERKSEH